MVKRKRGARVSVSASKNESNGNPVPSNTNHNEEQQGWSKSKKRHMRKMQKATTSDENEKKQKQKQAMGSPAAVDFSKADRRSKKKMKVSEKQEAAQPNKEKKSNDESLSLGNGGMKPKSALQQAFLARLAGSRFRELNEDLYTTNSSSAFERFQSNPELFDQYHEGFREQVKSWPVNPADAVYRWILSFNRKRVRSENSEPLVIADFGCGDAKLAEKLLKIRDERSNKKIRGKSKSKSKKENGAGETSNHSFKVHSFDLVANGNEHITPCDMANVPLEDGKVDIAVFVLALMGTNIADFIREAHRVLTPDGILKIAEVRSRFEASTASADNNEEEDFGQKRHGKSGGKNKFKYSKKKSDDSLLDEFVDVMQQLGFRIKQKDRNNKMFILLEFEKTGKKPSKDAEFTAKPCIYKRR